MATAHGETHHVGVRSIVRRLGEHRFRSTHPSIKGAALANVQFSYHSRLEMTWDVAAKQEFTRLCELPEQNLGLAWAQVDGIGFIHRHVWHVFHFFDVLHMKRAITDDEFMFAGAMIGDDEADRFAPAHIDGVH